MKGKIERKGLNREEEGFDKVLCWKKWPYLRGGGGLIQDLRMEIYHNEYLIRII